MADVVMKRCDACENEATHTVVFKESRRSDIEVDLCDEHYLPVDELRQTGRTPQGNRAYRRYRKQQYTDR